MERIVERESLKASELLLTNGAAQADVLARLRVASQEKRKECATRRKGWKGETVGPKNTMRQTLLLGNRSFLVAQKLI